MLFLCCANAQKIVSPSQFLGYELGTRFTSHDKVVNYFKSIASSASSKMKLQSYGFTNENNELLVAFVSSASNIQHLEEIQKNNLRLSGLLNDKIGDTHLPTVVWLNYNVHGNEASSTEVALKLLYELVSDKNDSLNKWLEHVVVIIDPCVNPDGRDRYVHWFNQVVGKNPVANPIAREHDEPWPGGRTNHYNFDLNRDWAWQTQIETQNRMVVYNQWMPQILCDFHEQYPNNPYYFAPAAEPFHEVITPWQRSFQTIIGKNHAKYFDANGWLYFTKEVFDLFYPSYGDTYPLYNGSIGMTYEQAGHSRGGLSISIPNDTLTLKDRINHHYTTSISTIETASNNFLNINESFALYFKDAQKNGVGGYKTFLIKNNNIHKIEFLLQFFKRNNIKYGYAKQGLTVKGFSYNTGEELTYNTSAADIFVSTYQNKGALVKVLFEPQSKLSDSVTYDITAWSIPYAFGLDALALNEKLEPTQVESNKSNNIIQSNQYAYLVDYNSFHSVVFLSKLLKNGIKVRFAEKDFTFNNKKFFKGTLIVLKNDNFNHVNDFIQFAKDMNMEVTSVSSGMMDQGVDFGSDKIHLLKKPSVALVTGESANANAAGEIWHLFEQQLDYPIILMNASQLSNASLKDLDVIIIPDGDYPFLGDKESNLKNWVRQGGKLIAIENAVSQMAFGDWGIRTKKDEELDKKEPSYSDIKRYEERERQSVASNIPGAIYKLNLDDSHPLAFGYPNYYFTLKLNSNVFEFMKEGWNVGVIKQENQVAGFVGNKIKSKIKDGTLIAAQDYGNGSIVYFADNPIFRSFWENGKMLLGNAIFLVGQQ